MRNERIMASVTLKSRSGLSVFKNILSEHGFIMKRLIVLIMIALIGGCASERQIPAELQYTPPVAKSKVATIQGSQDVILLWNDLTAFVIAVDGKRVMSERKGWDNKLPIAAGTRNITVAFQHGVYNAQADLSLNAISGRQYQVRFKSDAQLFGANDYCDFWIVDVDTQKPVTDIRRGLIIGNTQTIIHNTVFVPAKKHTSKKVLFRQKPWMTPFISQ